MTARASVFVGIADQIGNNAGEESAVSGGDDLGLEILRKRYAADIQCLLFATDYRYQLRQIAGSNLKRFPALFQAGKEEKLRNQIFHLHTLLLYGFQCFAVILRSFRHVQGKFALGQNNCHRSSELVGYIGCKLLFSLEGVFQTLKHAVIGIGQCVKFISAGIQLDAQGKIISAADGFCCGDNLLCRREAAAGYEISNQNGKQCKQRQKPDCRFHNRRKKMGSLAP